MENALIQCNNTVVRMHYLGLEGDGQLSPNRRITWKMRL